MAEYRGGFPMRSTKNRMDVFRPRCLAAALATAFTAGAAFSSGTASAADCAGLKGLTLKDTTILEAEVRPAGPNVITGTFSTVNGAELGHFNGNIPVSVCRVRVAIKPTPASNIISEYWLPVSNWNGRFDVTGNGGTAGSLSLNSMTIPVGLGYATATSDTGHQSTDSSFALVTYKGVPEQVEDFAHRGYHVTTQVGKQIVQAFYGAAADYSYFTGCSTGGAEALSEAQRYPDDFDGIIGGAPASGYSLMWPGEVFPSWVSSTYTNPQALITKLPALHTAVLHACDALDGKSDGIIDDPRKCAFDPATIQCSPGTDTLACLTPDQVTAVRKIYAGFRDPTTGEQIWHPYMLGSEDQWAGHIVQNNNPPVNYFRYFVYENPNWYYTDPTFNMEGAATLQTIYVNDAYWEPYLDSIDRNLTQFHQHGKIILFHGWKDQNIAPLHTVDYYNTIVPNANLTQNNSFARLYMVPGMQHCSGGPGPNTVNGQQLVVGLLTALRNWVEGGVAPQQIVAAHLTNGVADITRPLCPYPQAGVWTGVGSFNDAANFVCKNPSH
jgi:feruloyl esterase